MGQRIALLVTLLLAVGVVVVTATGDFSPERTAELIEGAGVLGAVAFLLAFAILQPLGVSSHIFILSASLIWDAWLAIGLSWLGALGTSIVSFLFARYVAFDWVQSRLPERVKKYEGWLLSHGVIGVIGIRILTFTTQPMQFMMGVIRIRFKTMLLGSAIGFLPLIAIEILLGGEILRRLLDWTTSAA